MTGRPTNDELGAPPPPDPGESARPLAELLIGVVRRVGQASSRAKAGSVSNARYDLLHVLVHHGPEAMGRVATRLGVAPRSLTDMVDALEGEGLLQRQPHPSDRRTQLLALTPQGLELVKAVRRIRLAGVATLLEPLTAAERVTLASLLERILNADRPA